MCYNLYPTPSRPDAPFNPTATVLDGGVLMQWDVPETVQPCSTYEVFVADSLGNQLNCTPAFVGGDRDGKRKVNRMGRVGSIHRWVFHPQAPGTYSWGVQTVDAAYNGSTFTTGPSFTIGNPTSIQASSVHSAGDAAVYSIEGIRYAAPRRGLNIFRQGQTMRKVMMP